MKHMKAMGLLALMMAAPVVHTAQAQTVTPRMYAVKLASRDFDRTTQFYTALGMKAGAHHNEWEWELRWDDPGRGSSIIMVDEKKSERFHVTRGGATLIISVPDLFDALARLSEAGFDISGEPHITRMSAIIMIQDPDGNWIELAGPAPVTAGDAE